MRKTTLVLMFTAFVILSALILPAYATKPTEVSGVWQSAAVPAGGIPVVYTVRTAGANAFLTFHNYANYTTGSFLAPGSKANIEQTIEITFHYSDPEYVNTLPTGTFTDRSKLTSWLPTDFSWKVDRHFTGKVLGVAGEFTMNLEGKGFGAIGNTVELEGTWTIISGSGGLSNLHGQGTWHSLGTQLNAFEGHVHFDP